MLQRFYWLAYDTTDFCVEQVGHFPSHRIRLWCYRHLFQIEIGRYSSIHRLCRFYQPAGVSLGNHTVVNRSCLLDGRKGIRIGNNVSISEGTVIFSLEHDPQSDDFENRGGTVTIEDYTFIGAQALILPNITLGRGSVVAARAVVTRDVPPYTIVAGVPARHIGSRSNTINYTLNYHKFLG